jgi:hypothetical protein
MNMETKSANRILLLLVALLLPFAAAGVYFLSRQVGARDGVPEGGRGAAPATSQGMAAAPLPGDGGSRSGTRPQPKSRIETLDQLVARFAEGSLDMVDDEWMLNGLTIDSFEMSEQEAIDVQKAVSATRNELMAMAQKHLAPDPLRTTDKKQAFLMKPFPEEGAALRAKMIGRVTEALGAERGTQFGRAFPEQSFCGDFGNLEIRMNVTPHLIADKTGLVVSYQCFRVSDGSRFGSGHMGLSELEESLGLKLEMETDLGPRGSDP